MIDGVPGMNRSSMNRMKMSMAVVICLTFLVSAFPVTDAADDILSIGETSGVGYYKGDYSSDTIPSSLEAGSSYPVVISFRNNGMVSWEWGVEKFGLLYQGLQSSITVDPVFSPIPAGIWNFNSF